MQFFRTPHTHTQSTTKKNAGNRNLNGCRVISSHDWNELTVSLLELIFMHSSQQHCQKSVYSTGQTFNATTAKTCFKKWGNLFLQYFKAQCCNNAMHTWRQLIKKYCKKKILTSAVQIASAYSKFQWYGKGSRCLQEIRDKKDYEKWQCGIRKFPVQKMGGRGNVYNRLLINQYYDRMYKLILKYSRIQNYFIQ